MSVSITDYLKTNVVKGFTSIDDIEKSKVESKKVDEVKTDKSIKLIIDLEKSDYQRVRNGKLEKVHDKRVKHDTKSITMGCGCDVKVPNHLNGKELDEWLMDNDKVKMKQTSSDEEVPVCTKCGKKVGE